MVRAGGSWRSAKRARLPGRRCACPTTAPCRSGRSSVVGQARRLPLFDNRALNRCSERVITLSYVIPSGVEGPHKWRYASRK